VNATLASFAAVTAAIEGKVMQLTNDFGSL